MARPTAGRLPWWEEDVTVINFHRTIAAALEEVQSMDNSALRALQARAFVSTVMVSTEVDNIPVSIITPEEICRHLTRIYEEILQQCPSNRPLRAPQLHIFETYNHEWSLHCIGPPPVVLSRLSQYLKALMFLCIYHRDDPLDMGLLKRTHYILMRGFRAHNRHIQPGCFRDCSFNDCGVFLIHEIAMRTSIDDMLSRLRGINSDEDLDDVDRSFFKFPDRLASLLHDMTHIQPFVVGNSWMCRLIMAHFLVSRDKFQFPIPIAPIKDRLCEQFVHTLFGADNKDLQDHEDVGFGRERTILSAFLLECVYDSLEELINA
ncbi:hypothetical protein GOP47_0001239 [Adiantum capillus-veneris]|uniref:Fido domain-containing protein n=1 Tax=Adiantum capillus-veneris TaxID=13818 RepID=A0A9D4VFG5_ADICA|nr:hypothetical protein GOP47_0001239 [Adiantum capillus-veneris]